jgi:hypothetical protein
MRPVKAACPKCGVAVEGDFKLPRIALLPPDEAAFLAEFVLSEFNIKKMEERVNLSYPAIRARLDRVIEHMKLLSTGAKLRKTILDRVERGEITADEAIRLIEASESEPK